MFSLCEHGPIPEEDLQSEQPTPKVTNGETWSIIVISSWVLCFHQSVHHAFESCWLNTSFGVVVVSRPSFHIKARVRINSLLREQHDNFVGSSCIENARFHNASHIHSSSSESNGKFTILIRSNASGGVVKIPSVSNTWCSSINWLWSKLVLIELKQGSVLFPWLS